MISTSDFQVSVAGDCAPLSLILPRETGELAMLMGWSMEGKPAAFILTGPHRFTCHLSEGADCWTGLVFSSIRIEMDETSTFSPQSSQTPLCSLVRQGTSLVARATAPDIRSSNTVVLEKGLPSAGELSVGFRRWQVVLGHGAEKRVLFNVGEPSDTVPPMPVGH